MVVSFALTVTLTASVVEPATATSAFASIWTFSTLPDALIFSFVSAAFSLTFTSETVPFAFKSTDAPLAATLTESTFAVLLTVRATFAVFATVTDATSPLATTLMSASFFATWISAPLDAFDTVSDNLLSVILISLFFPLSTKAFASLISIDFTLALFVIVAFFACTEIEAFAAFLEAGIVILTFLFVLITMLVAPFLSAFSSCFWLVTTTAFLFAA